jgi:D-amino-acid dehydrogenase
MSGGGRRVIVIGGGVIGAACAHYLSRAGWDVEIVDRGAFGKGCSHGNCGYVCPSHALPLAEPGAIGRTLRALFQKNSPFVIKPRIDPALWSWLWQFTRHCTEKQRLEGGRSIQALLNSSRSLYDELMREEPLDCEWETRGLLFVFQTQPAMEHYAETDKLLREKFQVRADRFDGPALTELEPALKPGLAGGFLYRGDAHLRPDKLMSSWRRVLEAHGVRIRENNAVEGFTGGDGQARAVTTAQGELTADAFVVATGAWTPFLNEHLGCRVPIEPGKGYSITMPRPARCPAYPLIFEEHRVAVTPMKSGYRLGSTMEFAGYDTSLNPRRLALLREVAVHYLHEPFREPVEEEWYGWRPMTPDSVPIIDRSPLYGNVLIAAGHNMLGLSMAPATGKLVAEVLSGTTTHVDLTPYRLGRW